MLTYNFAQRIVDRMMKVIPYNVNIMDSKGIIIASGDSLRVGKVHRGAFEAIERGILIEVYKSSGGAKPGVNMPIYYNNEIMGVIGISGDPKVVGSFAELVKITAELLITMPIFKNQITVFKKVIVNLLPLFSSLSTLILPFWDSIIYLPKYNPIPILVGLTEFSPL